MNYDQFSCSHGLLEKSWNQDGNQDYELTATVGKCGNCFGKDIRILTQIGVERFDGQYGFCIPCINESLPNDSILELDMSFADSDDIHTIRIDSEKVDTFLRNSKLSLTFSKEELNGLAKAVKENQNNPDLAQARKFKEKPHQCKNCYGYILTNNRLETLKRIRNNTNYAVICFGSGELLSRKKGCSMVMCANKICSIQICAFCVNGASTLPDFSHDIALCSKKIYSGETPLEVRLCECS